MSRPAARHLRAVDVPSREDLALVRGDLLSLKEVGELIGLRSRSAVIELLRKKRVRIVTLTRAWRVPRAELERVLGRASLPWGLPMMPNDAPRVPYSYQSGDGQRRRDRRTMIVPEFDVDLNWHRPDPDASTMGLPPATIWAFRFFGSLVGLGLGLLLIFNAIRGWHAP